MLKNAYGGTRWHFPIVTSNHANPSSTKTSGIFNAQHLVRANPPNTKTSGTFNAQHLVRLPTVQSPHLRCCSYKHNCTWCIIKYCNKKKIQKTSSGQYDRGELDDCCLKNVLYRKKFLPPILRALLTII